MELEQGTACTTSATSSSSGRPSACPGPWMRQAQELDLASRTASPCWTARGFSSRRAHQGGRRRAGRGGPDPLRDRLRRIWLRPSWNGRAARSSPATCCGAPTWRRSARRRFPAPRQRSLAAGGRTRSAPGGSRRRPPGQPPGAAGAAAGGRVRCRGSSIAGPDRPADRDRGPAVRRPRRRGGQRPRGAPCRRPRRPGHRPAARPLRPRAGRRGARSERGRGYGGSVAGSTSWRAIRPVSAASICARRRPCTDAAWPSSDVKPCAATGPRRHRCSPPAERARAVSSRLPAVRPPDDPSRGRAARRAAPDPRELCAAVEQDRAASEPLLRKRRELERAHRRPELDGVPAAARSSARRPLDAVRAGLADRGRAMVTYIQADGRLSAVVVSGRVAGARPRPAAPVIEQVRRIRADLDVLAHPGLPTALRTAVRASFDRSLDAVDSALLRSARGAGAARPRLDGNARPAALGVTAVAAGTVHRRRSLGDEVAQLAPRSRRRPASWRRWPVPTCRAVPTKPPRSAAPGRRATSGTEARPQRPR